MHTYKETGTYTCSLTVTDSNGKTQTDSIKLTVVRNKPPVVTISINKNTIERKFVPILHTFPGYAGDKQRILDALGKRDPYIFGEGQIVCSAQVEDPEDDEIVSYNWTHITDSQVCRSGEVLQPTHHFEGKSIKIPELYTWTMGRHVITLTVEDSAGNKANASIEFQVDKSLKTINRETKKRMIKSGLTTWNLYGNKFLGAAVAGVILSMWKFNNFAGTKIVGLLVLKFVFQLPDIEEDVLMKQIQVYLEDHSFIKERVDYRLNKIISTLEKLKEKYPDRNVTIDGAIDVVHKILEAFYLENKRPVISNPYPEEDETFVDLNTQKVFITVTDSEGDPFSVTISGDYVNNITYNNEHNGSFNATLNTPLPANTEITWNIIVTDEYDKEVTGEYTFTTRYE